MNAVGCATCGAVHLGVEGTVCPACGSGPISPAEPERPVPERVIPRRIDARAARERLAAFVAPVWFAVDELAPEVLASRLAPVWWPAWLVDVNAAGIWEAEAGFDYAVQSSQEVYGGSGWTTQQVTDTRTRWERRTGRLRRKYDNLAVPALGDDPVSARDPAASEPWTERAIDGAIRLPDRSPEEQWPAVLEQLRAQSGAECARACGAEHVRELFLDVDANGAHWTLLLRPGYTTWYTDEAGRTHVLRIDGATGEVAGPRFASVARGRRWALAWFAAGGSIVAVGLLLALVGVVLWFLLPVAGVVLVGGALIGMIGAWPWLQPGRWNQGQGSVG